MRYIYCFNQGILFWTSTGQINICLVAFGPFKLWCIVTCAISVSSQWHYLLLAICHWNIFVYDCVANSQPSRKKSTAWAEVWLQAKVLSMFPTYRFLWRTTICTKSLKSTAELPSKILLSLVLIFICLITVNVIAVVQDCWEYMG